MSTVLGTLRKALHAVPREFKSSLHNGRGLASPAAFSSNTSCVRVAQMIVNVQLDVARTSILA